MFRVRQTVVRKRETDNVKRRLLIVVVFLLAGAVVNVMVAWGCSIRAKSASFDALLTARMRRQQFEASKRSDQLETEAPWVKPEALWVAPECEIRLAMKRQRTITRSRGSRSS